MSTDPETTRIVRSWLGTDEHESADRVLDAVLSRLDTTPQRRHLWPTRRHTHMTDVTRIAAGAAAAIAVAVVGYTMLSSDGGAGGPAVAPTVSPLWSPSPVPSAVESEATDGSIPALDNQSSLGGRYMVGSGLRSRVTVAAPADWSAGDDWTLRGPKGYPSPAGMGIRFYPVKDVYKDPTDMGEGVVLPRVGPSVADLADAIVEHPGWTALEAVDVTMDGFEGKMVRLQIPRDAPEGAFYLFEHALGGQIWGLEAGQVFDIYIIDVAGERVVIDAFSYPGTSSSDLAAQRAVLDSIEFEPAP
jgi:hypothetical protein